ncbi:MAG: carbohydrate binding domain-containing protein [Planctomycetota bacterium]
MHRLWLIGIVCMALTTWAEELLPNGDFEGRFSEKGIADGWADNSSWADLDVTYAREAENPRSGTACQKIACTRLGSGAVQMIPMQGIPLKKGKIYRIRAWLRGDPIPVAVQLRLAGAPYTVYVEKHAVPGKEWQEGGYFWTSNVDDPKARLMLRFSDVGAIRVDDISVQELTLDEALKAAPPPAQGNLLHNGDFDLGSANWLLHHPCDNWREADPAVEQGEHGPCLKVVVPEGISAAICSDAVDVSPGHPIVISCRMRADRPATVRFHSNHCGREVQVVQEWRAFEAKGRAGFGPRPYDFVRFSIRGPATVWLDDVQLRQDGKTEGERPRAAIVSDRHPMSLYHDGETPTLRLMRSSAAPIAVEWKVENFWGRVVRSGASETIAGRNEARIPCAGLPRGWYHASVAWKAGNRECRNESAFAILPPPGRTGDVQTSPFGAHFALDPTSLKLARAVGVRWLRLHPPNHTKWRVVEPKKGEWAWRDEPIRIAREAGLELCGSLDRCPTWASSAPPGTPERGFYTGTGAWLPRDWAEWEDYVARTVRRYKKDIHIWEIWNEPNLTEWLIPREGQTRAQAYVELLQHTTPIVRREDPAATVIGACVAGAMREKSPARQFAFDIIDLGALRLMDVFSFHEYIGRSVDEGDEPIAVWIGRLRDKMRAAGRDLPIINSEGGYANPGSAITYRPGSQDVVPPDKMARWLVRQYVAQTALGVGRFYFYNFFIDGSPVVQGWEGFLEGDGQPRPNVAAYATMTWLLDGATFERTDQPTDNLWIHTFTTPRGRLAVAWARTGATARQIFEDAKQSWDLIGAEVNVPDDRTFTITDAPLYILMGK